MRAELGELAVLEDEARGFVVGGEFFEDVLRGRDDLALAVLERLWEAHFVEEDFAELLGGVDVELRVGEGVDLLLEAGHEVGDVAVLLAEEVGIDLATGLLHAEEDGDQGEVDLPVGFEKVRFFDLGLEGAL